MMSGTPRMMGKHRAAFIFSLIYFYYVAFWQLLGV